MKYLKFRKILIEPSVPTSKSTGGYYVREVGEQERFFSTYEEFETWMRKSIAEYQVADGYLNNYEGEICEKLLPEIRDTLNSSTPCTICDCKEMVLIEGEDRYKCSNCGH
jgi:hypothetical protein